jgi:hypothetical protein
MSNFVQVSSHRWINLDCISRAKLDSDKVLHVAFTGVALVDDEYDYEGTEAQAIMDVLAFEAAVTKRHMKNVQTDWENE